MTVGMPDAAMKFEISQSLNPAFAPQRSLAEDRARSVVYE